MKRSEVELLTLYTNIKTGNPYVVTGFAVHSESGDELVLYMRADRPGKLFARPLSLFLTKFAKRY